MNHIGCSLEANILLTSVSYTLNAFFIFAKFTFFDIFISKTHTLPTHSYTGFKKNIKFFYDNFGYVNNGHIFCGKSKLRT